MKRKFERIIIRILLKLPGSKKLQIDSTVEPIWILGMFRSGTSFLSNVLYDAGLDFGKPKYLLQAQGKLKDLNPKGFYEDFVFAEISRLILNNINKSGENPPKTKDVNKTFFDTIDINRLILFSYFYVGEDRISFQNKLSAYFDLKLSGITGYLHKNFRKRFAIKIPLLTFFHRDLLKFWPNSRFIVVFRNPDSVIKSSKILTDKANVDLYSDFYQHLLEMEVNTDKIIYVSYDHFLKDPTDTVEKLALFTGIEADTLKKSYKTNFDESLIRNRPTNLSDTPKIKIYEDLLNKL